MSIRAFVRRFLNPRGIFLAFQITFGLTVFGQVPVFQKALQVGIEAPVVLDVVLSQGDVSIMYNRDGQVTVYAIPKDDTTRSAAEAFVKSSLWIDQKENHITIRLISPASLLPLRYRIEVPLRTEVTSSVQTGSQELLGISGPATISSGVGDIDATYVSQAPVQARTGKGKISCTRVMQVDAETKSGSITLMEDGPSKAVVKTGFGGIEIGGARGRVEAATDGGGLHIKAALEDDWELTSVSGSIQIELPPRSRFDFDVSTTSGHLSIERDEMHQVENDAHQSQQKVDGGGKRVQARSVSGNITIQ